MNDRMVSSYAVDTGEGILLFDPLDVSAELRERATAVVAHVSVAILATRRSSAWSARCPSNGATGGEHGRGSSR